MELENARSSPAPLQFVTHQVLGFLDLEFQVEKSERDILADYVDFVKFKDFHPLGENYAPLPTLQVNRLTLHPRNFRLRRVRSPMPTHSGM